MQVQYTLSKKSYRMNLRQKPSLSRTTGADARVYVWFLVKIDLALILDKYVCSNRDRFGFYAEITV